MRILLASDKFKGTLTAAEVAACLRTPLEKAGHTVRAAPLADGGDGTVEAVLSAGFTAHSADVTGPLGTPVTARWALSADGTAVIEMAEASGLAALVRAGRTPDDDTARRATTYGTGELITLALEAGARDIVLGVGGSATTDGGTGMLMALGAQLWDAAGERLTDPADALSRTARVNLAPTRDRLKGARLLLASDVENPLCGSRGAAAVFGPQKGAGEKLVGELDAALAAWAARTDPALADVPGAGAAGGTGFAAMLLGASTVSGAEYILTLTGFDAALDACDAVVTGEGRFDAQTLEGKGPAAVIARARSAHIPVYAVCGSADPAAAEQAGLAGLCALTDRASEHEALTRPEPLLAEIGAELAAALS